jgi:hypothetical protein
MMLNHIISYMLLPNANLSLLLDNFGRSNALFSQHAPAHEFLYFYCHDYSNNCGQDLRGRAAYSWDDLGFFWVSV